MWTSFVSYVSNLNKVGWDRAQDMRKIRKYVLVGGGMSLGVVFKNLKAHVVPSSPSLLPFNYSLFDSCFLIRSKL